MPFSESMKLNVKRKSHFRCCLCHEVAPVEIHHILPQADGGPDTEDNAAPLCPTCHTIYGANPEMRKYIRDSRDFWYKLCEERYASDPQRLDKIESLLKTIEAHVQTEKFPLLPFSLFYTLRHTTTSDAIERAFKNAEGYKSLKSDILQLVGSGRLDGLGIYNSIDMRPNHSHCILSNEALNDIPGIEELGFGESVVKHPVNTVIEFYLLATNSNPDTPSLILRPVPPSKPLKVQGLELFDDVIFQDSWVGGWEITNPSRRSWSISDLRGARIQLHLEMYSYDDINLQYPPRLHNLHMYFGTTAPHILFFTAKQLESPIVMENPTPKMRWDFSAIPEFNFTFRPLLMKYEFHIDEELFYNQIKQVA